MTKGKETLVADKDAKTPDIDAFDRVNVFAVEYWTVLNKAMIACEKNG